MNNTAANDLLVDKEFCRLSHLRVPAKNLVSQYAPDRSVRWLQEVQKQARETVQDKSQYKGKFNLHYAAFKPNRIPACPMPNTTGWMRLEGDYAVVTDIHVPYYHAPTLERLMDEAEDAGIDQLIIGGDLFDFNMFHHGPRGAAHQRRGQDDVEVGRGVLKGLLEHFKTIKVFMGNHDEYLAKDLRNHFESDFLFSKFFGEFKNRIRWSAYGHCDVVSGGVPWKITHGTSFSEANPLGPAQKMAEKFSCNIMVGHQHRVGERHGKYSCLCLGGAFDETRMGYLNYQPTPNETPKRSFAILKDGLATHIYKGL